MSAQATPHPSIQIWHETTHFALTLLLLVAALIFDFEIQFLSKQPLAVCPLVAVFVVRSSFARWAACSYTLSRGVVDEGMRDVGVWEGLRCRHASQAPF